jgi:PiT family inorganic phosphate transporter
MKVALGTSVGSGALSIRNAILLGAVFEFLGTIIMGRFVTGTIKSGIIDISVYQVFSL